MSSYQYRDSHVKDKTVSPTVLSLTWESPYLGKTVFILRRGPGSLQCWAISKHSADYNIRHLAKFLFNDLKFSQVSPDDRNQHGWQYLVRCCGICRIKFLLRVKQCCKKQWHFTQMITVAATCATYCRPAIVLIAGYRADNQLGVGGSELLAYVCQLSIFLDYPDCFMVMFHIHIWQVSPQLSCGDTCQIWMWFGRSNGHLHKSNNFPESKTEFLCPPTQEASKMCQ